MIRFSYYQNRNEYTITSHSVLKQTSDQIPSRIERLLPFIDHPVHSLSTILGRRLKTFSPFSEGARHRPGHIDISSDNTEADATEISKKHMSPARKTRTRRGRHRGNVVGKKIIRSTRPPRCHSRASTGSTNSEEVTYSFEDKDHVSFPSTSQHGAYRIEYEPYKDFDTYSKRRKVRHTPIPRHDITPETPGTDECRPLVTAIAKPALISPLEEDESTGLLERWAPIPAFFSLWRRFAISIGIRCAVKSA